jgi:hypothetical protein
MAVGRHVVVEQERNWSGGYAGGAVNGLIDNVDADNAGQALLELVNDVRNESGRSDPLLIVAACARVPPGAVGQRVIPIGDIDKHTYPRWKERVPQSRRKQEKSTWYLPLRARPVSAKEAVEQVELDELVAPRPPRWVSWGFVVGLSLALVAGLAVWARPTVIALSTHCFGGVFDPGG